MSHESKENLVQENGGIISIDQAKQETQLWREMYSRMFGGESQLIKAFFIPMADIQCLFENYKRYSPSGVRAYIGVRESAVVGVSRLSLLLVPATETEDLWNKGTRSAGIDIDDYSSIYDFTTPCPDTCSANGSPLM